MKKKWISVLLTVAMVLTCVPATVFAADAAKLTVRVGSTTLSEGENKVGDGTATLDTANGTLTLDNAVITEFMNVESDEAVNIVVRGNSSIGSEDAATKGVALYSTAPTLNIRIEQNATLSLYTEGGNNVYAKGGSLTVSGPGKLIGNTVTGNSGAYPSLAASQNITLTENLDAEILSEWHGVYTEAGDITVSSAKVNINALGVGLFAQSYDEPSDTDIPSSVTMTKSYVTLDTSGGEMQAVYCGTGKITVEDTVLTTKTNKDKDSEGWSLYSSGDIFIRGEQTVLTADDGVGIQADGGSLNIESGQVSVNSSDTALSGWEGVNITGGTVRAESTDNSAIVGRDEAVSFTGESTSVVAASGNKEYATVRNVRDGGIYLSACVTAENTAGGRPFEGVKEDKTAAIVLGEGFELSGAEIYTEVGRGEAISYFIPAGGDGSVDFTGKAVISRPEPEPEPEPEPTPPAPAIQKPTVEADPGANVELSVLGSVATITVEEGYELVDVTLNGESLGKATTVRGLRTGDKLVVKVKKKLTPEEEKLIAGVKATSIEVSALQGDGYIRLDWNKSGGYKVDAYEIFRSTEKDGDYGDMPYFTTKQGGLTGWYKNTKELEKGTKYYYKIRGKRVIGGETYYTQWSDVKEQVYSDIGNGVRNTTIKAQSTAGKGYIRVNWKKSAGYRVDYYQVYRSTKKSSFGKEAYFATKQGGMTGWYKNTKELKKGTRYYYKVRGVRELDGKNVYTKWSTLAFRIAK